MKIILSGFAPYGGEWINSSGELIAALRDIPPARIHPGLVDFVILPADEKQLANTLPGLLDGQHADYLLMFGQAPGRAEVNFEQVARNDFQGRRIWAGGPDFLHASLPNCPRMVDALNAVGIPAILSEDAGDYFCNMALYLALAYAERNDHRISAGFIHVPILPVQADAHPPETPLISLAQLQFAVSIILAQLPGSQVPQHN